MLLVIFMMKIWSLHIMEHNIITAALIIIGNEVLSGRTKDKNIGHIADRLNEQGIQLMEVRIIPDIEDSIIAAVNALRIQYDHVITTGGIGPTHDDITSESIAKAVKQPYEIHQEAYNILKAYYDSKDMELNEGRIRMTKMPRDAILIDNPLTGAPGFTIENIHVLPGVPQIMQEMLEILLKRLDSGAIKHQITIESPFPESYIACELDTIQKQFSDVDIGSYPKFDKEQSQFQNAIVIRGFDEKSLQECHDSIYNMLDKKIKSYGEY